MKKYTSKHITSILMEGERNEIMIHGFSIRVLHTILHYRKDWLKDYQELSTPLRVVFEDNGQKLEVGKGNICLIMANDNHIGMRNVYYVPRVAKHLLSIG